MILRLPSSVKTWWAIVLRLLTLGVAAVGAVCVRVEQLAQREAVGGFSWSEFGMDGHRWKLLRAG